MDEKKLTPSFDAYLRPKRLDDYVGQKTLKENLKILLGAAKKRKELPEHILLYGPAGLGKTTLANIISNELSCELREMSGVMIEKSGDIIALASSLEKGGVLFIDEIHRLNKNIEEVLYPIMETGKVSIMVGKGATAKAIDIALEPVLIIGATTQIAKISNPLRSRFGGGVLRLNEYSEEEIIEILKNSAKKLKIEVDNSSLKEIARRSRNTPRTANYLLKRVRDFAEVNMKKISKELTRDALELKEIDSYGLTSEDRRLLKIIKEIFSGGPVGIKALSIAMSEEKDTVEEIVEPFLIQIGFIERKQNGRYLTKKGEAYLKNCGI